MTIKNAKYFNTQELNADNEIVTILAAIGCVINGVPVSVPLDPDNTHYAEILRQIAAGTLTIEDAD